MTDQNTFSDDVHKPTDHTSFAQALNALSQPLQNAGKEMKTPAQAMMLLRTLSENLGNEGFLMLSRQMSHNAKQR